MFLLRRRKMIWAEISFFSKWWNDIDEQKRAMVKRYPASLKEKLLRFMSSVF